MSLHKSFAGKKKVCKTGFESSDESDEDAWRFRCGPGLECVQAHVQREAGSGQTRKRKLKKAFKCFNTGGLKHSR